MENILEFISNSFKSNDLIKKLNFAIKYEKELNIPYSKIIHTHDIHIVLDEDKPVTWQDIEADGAQRLLPNIVRSEVDSRIYPLNYLRYILFTIDNKIKDENSEKIKNLYNKELLQLSNEKK